MKGNFWLNFFKLGTYGNLGRIFYYSKISKRNAEPGPDPHRHGGYGHHHHHHGWGHHHHHHHHGWGHHHHHGWHGHFHFLHKRDVQNVDGTEAQITKRNAEPHDSVVLPHGGHYDVVTLPHHHHHTHYNHNQGYYGYRPLFHSFGKRSADQEDPVLAENSQLQTNKAEESDQNQTYSTFEKRSAEPHDSVVLPHGGHYDVVTLPHHHHQTHYNHNQGYYGYRPLFHSFGKRSADQEDPALAENSQLQTNKNSESKQNPTFHSLEKRSAEPHDSVVLPHGGHYDVVTLPHHHHHTHYNHNQGYNGYNRPLFHSYGKRSADQEEPANLENSQPESYKDNDSEQNPTFHTLEKRSAEPHDSVVLPHGGHYDVVTLPHHHHYTHYNHNQGYFGSRPLYHSFGKRSADQDVPANLSNLDTLPSPNGQHQVVKRNADPQYVSSIVIPHNNHLDVVKVPYHHQNQHYHLTGYSRPTYYSYYG